MKTKILYLLPVALVILFGSSCRHKTDFDSLPAVSYQNDINPIIIGNCTQAKCHGTVDPEEFELLTYDDVIDHGKVKAGDPDGSRLYKVITTLSGESRMPREPYDMLTDEQITKIYVWIGQGAKNN